MPTSNLLTSKIREQPADGGPITVLFCSDRHYCRYMGVAITSLLINNPGHIIHLILVLLDEDADSRKQLARVVSQFPNADVEFKVLDSTVMQEFPVGGHITHGTYVRLFLAEFLSPTIEKILYLDCDLLICGDVEGLWNADLAGCPVGAVRDVYSDYHTSLGFEEDETYFNAGVLLINVRQWRAESLQSTLVKYITDQKTILRYHDQDAINAVLRNRIASLPFKWNFAARNADLAASFLGLRRGEFLRLRENPAIIHFTTPAKPWIDFFEPHYKNLYLKYLAMTPWDDSAQSGKINISFSERKAKFMRQTVTFLKWHFPLLRRHAPKWTGFNDLDFHRSTKERKHSEGV